MAENYGARDIEVLKGLDAVRMRPGMYIGTTGVKGMHHILWEIVDNAMDEALNGYGNLIEIEIFPDNSISAITEEEFLWTCIPWKRFLR